MKGKVQIELGAKAVKQFVEGEFKEEDLNLIENPPIDTYSIIFKFSDLVAMEDFKVKAKLNNLNLNIVDYMTRLHVTYEVKIAENELIGDLIFKEPNNSVLKFKIQKDRNVEVLSSEAFRMEDSELSYQIAKLLKISIGVMKYIMTPNVYIRKTVEKEPRGYNKRAKKGKKAKKSYIYKTRYVIDHINCPKPPKTSKSTDSSRNYSRITPEWTRKGHMRRYRNPDGSIKKEVWIESTKCKSKVKGDKIFRITRVE